MQQRHFHQIRTCVALEMACHVDFGGTMSCRYFYSSVSIHQMYKNCRLKCHLGYQDAVYCGIRKEYLPCHFIYKVPSSGRG
jgi:hypothetical protein